MKPIISHWLIYFAELFDGINTTCLFIAGVSFIVMMFAFIPYLDNSKDIRVKKCLHKSLVCFCISVIVMIATPSKDTMYTMLVLDNVTTDNIQAIGKTGKDVVDYITDQIDKVVNKDEEKENK